MSSNKDIHQITVVSGKGGTGKSSIIAALAYLLKDRAVLVDADVDAADLYLIYPPKKTEKFEYYGAKLAEIDFEKCTRCNLCQESCRFDAIDKELNIDPFKCEGCALCFHVCPVDAITMKERLSGNYYESATRIGKMFHAKLEPGQENTGLLVAEIRKKANEEIKNLDKNLILIDGSPGIGCPVISSITGSKLAIIVTEPTISGKHDLERILELLRQFRIPGFVIVNKSDINLKITEEIEKLYKENNEVIAKIPFNSIFTRAMLEKKSVVEIEAESEQEKEIQGILKNIANILNTRF
ncbi:MAG: ATP-binding protein [Candidatus Heimdallarchaeaceae archaeon]